MVITHRCCIKLWRIWNFKKSYMNGTKCTSMWMQEIEQALCYLTWKHHLTAEHVHIVLKHIHMSQYVQGSNHNCHIDVQALNHCFTTFQAYNLTKWYNRGPSLSILRLTPPYNGRIIWSISTSKVLHHNYVNLIRSMLLLCMHSDDPSPHSTVLYLNILFMEHI